MSKEPVGRGVSKQQWLEAGLDALSRFPATEVRVDDQRPGLSIRRSSSMTTVWLEPSPASCYWQLGIMLPPK